MPSCLGELRLGSPAVKLQDKATVATKTERSPQPKATLHTVNKVPSKPVTWGPRCIFAVRAG